MNKNDLLRQKIDLEKLLGRSFVPRVQLPAGEKILESNLVKVVIGPRRAGKSVYCLELLKDKKFAYLNFDDKKMIGADEDEVFKILQGIYPQARYYLFDEIQNLPGWELFINKLQRRGHNIILTGSNAKLLSGELATHLTGRFLEIEILPFSFAEYKKAKKRSIWDYLTDGGFPETVVEPNDPKVYLPTLFDSIILNDVIQRHNVKYTAKINELASYVLANTAGTFTYSKLASSLGFPSVLTLQKYFSYLIQTYLFFELLRFSPKIKEQFKAPRKIYTVDNGFITSRAFAASPNYGKLCENLVFIELVRRGYRPNLDLFYYQTRNGKEVDFVLKRGHKVEQLIQVCYSLDQTDTKKREESTLSEAEEELSCENSLIITGNNLGEWLLSKSVVGNFGK